MKEINTLSILGIQISISLIMENFIDKEWLTRQLYQRRAVIELLFFLSFGPDVDNRMFKKPHAAVS